MSSQPTAVRDEMIPGTSIRMCWNPKCDYAFPNGTTQCRKCGWTAAGRSEVLTISETPAPPMKARAKTDVDGREMNKAETRYSQHLEAELKAGRIRFYAFESMKLRLADGCQFIPDFMVVDADSFIEFHDVKAKWKGATGPHIEDDAMVKLKVAAEQYKMFTIKAVWLDGETWNSREF